MELAAGRKSGLKPEEKSVLDRCVQLIYQPYLQDPKPANLPILEDLYGRLWRLMSLVLVTWQPYWKSM
jgi:hypothetical protein